MDAKRICKKCLIREMADQQDLYAMIQNQLDLLKEEDRVPKEEYERRLDCCKDCEKYLSGMCRSCGCYVEIRAAGKNKDCPNHRWGR